MVLKARRIFEYKISFSKFRLAINFIFSYLSIGFIAPEIHQYNGEEEYTEKVDCFSFGMFIFELISLRLPFEGQESIKDHILEGLRPKLTQRDILYPSYVLDLMIQCWSQQANERPATSHIGMSYCCVHFC